MALSAAITWEVRQGGSDANGGGFVTGASGTDYSLQDSPEKSGTGAAIHASDNTKFNPGVAVSANDIGNVVSISAGSGFTTGRYHITAQDGTYWTLDRACGATSSTGGTYAMGGALASPALAAGVKVAGNRVAIKYSATPYSITSTTPNVSGGRVSETTGGVASGEHSYWFGYDTTRTPFNTDANRPTLVADGISSTTLFDIGAVGITVTNQVVDGDDLTGIEGLDCGQSEGGSRVFRCKAQHCTNGGIVGGLSSIIWGCEVTGCSGAPALWMGGSSASNGGTAGLVYGCWSHDNDCQGFYKGQSYGCVFVNCLSTNNTGSAGDGFFLESGYEGYTCINCTAAGNAQDGFNATSSFLQTVAFISCLSYDNGDYGFACTAGAKAVVMLNCAYGANATADVDSDIAINVGGVSLSADPFVDAAGDDYRLNAAAGGGALCRGAGYLGTFPGGMANGLDIGALQHIAAGGGGGGLRWHPGMNGGING